MASGPKPRPVGKRGGKRPNAGPKTRNLVLSKEQVQELFEALKQEGIKKGITWQENFAKHIFSDDWQEAAAFHRMLTSHMQRADVKDQKKEEPEKKKPISLPSINPDPAKIKEFPIKASG